MGKRNEEGWVADSISDSDDVQGRVRGKATGLRFTYLHTYVLRYDRDERGDP
jgi:hypothetical protein